MNQLELTIKINQLKREIKNLESSISKTNKKIKANQDILDETLFSKRKFQQNISEMHSNLNSRLSRIDGAFPSYYRNEHNKILKKGDLDNATESLTQTINKAKHSIVNFEYELANLNRKITAKKKELRHYQTVLSELGGDKQ